MRYHTLMIALRNNPQGFNLSAWLYGPFDIYRDDTHLNGVVHAHTCCDLP